MQHVTEAQKNLFIAVSSPILDVDQIAEILQDEKSVQSWHNFAKQNVQSDKTVRYLNCSPLHFLFDTQLFKRDPSYGMHVKAVFDLLIEKNVNVLHKNSQGQSAFALFLDSAQHFTDAQLHGITQSFVNGGLEPDKSFGEDDPSPLKLAQQANNKVVLCSLVQSLYIDYVDQNISEQLHVQIDDEIKKIAAKMDNINLVADLKRLIVYLACNSRAASNLETINQTIKTMESKKQIGYLNITDVVTDIKAVVVLQSTLETFNNDKKYINDFMSINDFQEKHDEYFEILHDAMLSPVVQYPDFRMMVMSIVAIFITLSGVGAFLWLHKDFRQFMLNSTCAQYFASHIKTLQAFETKYGLTKPLTIQLKETMDDDKLNVGQKVSKVAQLIKKGANPYALKTKPNEAQAKTEAQIIYWANLSASVIKKIKAKIKAFEDEKLYEEDITEIQQRIDFLNEVLLAISNYIPDHIPLDDAIFAETQKRIQAVLKEKAEDPRALKWDLRKFLLVLLATVITCTGVGALAWFSRSYRNFMVNSASGEALGAAKLSLDEFEERTVQV